MNMISYSNQICHDFLLTNGASGVPDAGRIRHSGSQEHLPVRCCEHWKQRTGARWRKAQLPAADALAWSDVKLLKTTKPTAGKAVQLPENLGVLTETTGKQRDRTFAYASYIEKLRVGTEIDVR
jgi:hypothetical protein